MIEIRVLELSVSFKFLSLDLFRLSSQQEFFIIPK